jgi:Fe-S-cluster containining protein
MFEKIKKFIHSKILRKHYWRTGKCKGCGECCSHIYVKHFRHVLKDEKEFERLQYIHSFYSGLKVIGKDELGLIFECTHLDKETKRCKIHYRRPGICRRYPQEELFSMGGTLSDKCGYKMEPIVSFKEVLNKIEKKHNKKIVR